MKIAYAQNPLASRIELDHLDRVTFRQIIATELCDELYDEDDFESTVLEYEQALLGTHVGDCTCVPCSCSKCGAEQMLGIDTIPGMTKYVGNQIEGAFRDGSRTLDEAITYLANYSPGPCPDPSRQVHWDTWAPKWQEDAAKAHAWLVSYRDRTQVKEI